MSAERLRFSTAILRLLGEQLNPSPDEGILELIKNAYDADATQCIVSLNGAHLPGGSLTVTDDGTGLTTADIRDGWLVVGNSLKIRRNASPRGRLLVGNKGLGRLAALRLGKKVTLTSRPAVLPGMQFRVELDWRKFDQVKVVEEVEIEVYSETPDLGAQCGTSITIEELPNAWTEKDMQRLARAILLLTDPFQPSRGFRPILLAPEFEAAASRAKEGYFNECDLHLIAELDHDGKAHAEVRDASGAVLFSCGHAELAGSNSSKGLYRAPAAKFELWEFKLSGRGFSTKTVSLGAVKEWLREFGGVRLYHRGVRVLPYGEPKNDWLDMNLQRARNPELRPSTNNSIGLVSVADPRGLLEQKTDRSAFVESEAFNQLREFAGDVLEWMASSRVKERDSRRKAERERVAIDKRSASTKMTEVVNNLLPSERPTVEAALRDLQAAHEAEVNLLGETAQLYYTLGTVGTTAAAFAHQTKHPLGAIVEDANALENWLGDPEELALFREQSSRAVGRIKLEADAIYAFANVTLRLLEHEKRRSRRNSIHELVDCAIELLSPYLDARHTTIHREFMADEPYVWCTRASFEAIVTNFITNSLQAFATAERSGVYARDADGRKIFIQTKQRGDKVSLTFADNGPGIDRIAVDDVWLPGKTTTEKGTGLGLTIVRDIVLDLGGTVDAVGRSEFGGAKFVVTLPSKR
jgi:signal transduction histidine kinase